MICAFGRTRISTLTHVQEVFQCLLSLRFVDGDVMQFGPFATYSDALGFVSYMAQFDSFDSVRVVRNNG